MWLKAPRKVDVLVLFVQCQVVSAFVTSVQTADDPALALQVVEDPDTCVQVAVGVAVELHAVLESARPVPTVTVGTGWDSERLCPSAATVKDRIAVMVGVGSETVRSC